MFNKRNGPLSGRNFNLHFASQQQNVPATHRTLGHGKPSIEEDLNNNRRQASLFKSGKDSNSQLSFQASELITGRAVPVTRPVRPDHLTLLQNSEALNETLNEASFLQSNGSTGEAVTARTRAGHAHLPTYQESPFGKGMALPSAFTSTINQAILMGVDKV
jgi:hypothetical protein